MRKWLIRILLAIGVILLLLVLSVIIVFLTKSKERISFVNLNPAYTIKINKEIYKQVMEAGPENQVTTWHPAGDKFAARKVWVIIEPWSSPAYDTLVSRSESLDHAYSIHWVEKGDIDLLLIRINNTNLKTWTPHVQSQMLNIATLEQIVLKYPTGGISYEDINARLGKIYLDNTQFPLAIRSRF